MKKTLKNFEEPTVEVVEFDNVDILATEGSEEPVEEKSVGDDSGDENVYGIEDSVEGENQANSSDEISVMGVASESTTTSVGE